MVENPKYLPQFTLLHVFTSGSRGLVQILEGGPDSLLE